MSRPPVLSSFFKDSELLGLDLVNLHCPKWPLEKKMEDVAGSNLNLERRMNTLFCAKAVFGQNLSYVHFN